MREIKNKLTTGKNTKNTQSRKAKSFGYQILGFGSGGGLPVRSLVADMMVIGGGGGSAIAPSPGGGGGGGMVFIPASDMTPHFTTVVGDLDITIGGGGAGQRSQGNGDPGRAEITPGGNTTLVDSGGNAFTAFNGIGGGSGGVSAPTFNPTYSIPGGSGGGGKGESGSPGATNPGGSTTQAPGMPAPLQPFGFGNAGGNGTSCGGSPSRHGAGGGGAGGSGNPSGGSANGGNGKSVTPLFGSAPQPYYIANGSNAGASACGVFGGGGGGAQDPQRAHQGDLGAAEMHPIHRVKPEMELQTREVAEEPDVILTHHKVETTLHLVVMGVLDMF